MIAVEVQEIIVRGTEVASSAPVGISAEALEGVRVGEIFAQQGDLYFTKLATLPAGARQLVRHNGQLAPGNTQGSRHCVDMSRCTLWALAHPTALDGPVIESPDGITVTHPEHGWLTFPPGPGIYQVTFQRAYAEELRRVAD